MAPLLRLQGFVNELALDLLLDGRHRKIPIIANAAERRDSRRPALVHSRLTLFKAIDRRTYERGLLEARGPGRSRGRAPSKRPPPCASNSSPCSGTTSANSLAALAAGARMLGREQLSDRGRTVLSEMDRSIERASGLIDDVLDLARGSLGGGFVVNSNSDAPLTPVLEQVVAEIRAIAEDRRIDARMDIDEPVYCDRGRLAQLASNLLSNAVTHGSKDRSDHFRSSDR